MVYKDTQSILLYIKSIMTLKKIKNRDLAQKMNLSQAALSSRLNQENISFNLLIEICEALDICMDINFVDKKFVIEKDDGE